jgi:glucose/arabinose dehydrogenase
MKSPRFWYCLGAMSMGVVAPAGQAQVAIGFDRIGPANAFAVPTALAQPPGERRRLYIIEQHGAVKWTRDGEVQPAPLLQVPGLVSGNESGLLGLAFHPQFQTNGYMYLLFTTDVAPMGTRIMRYTMNPANPESIEPNSEYPIMTIQRPPSYNHQAGWIGFGPDGYLYISSGEAGELLQSQVLTDMLGKILRIDVDQDGFPNDPHANYTIPPTNPAVGIPGALGEIWARGLRNPWRCSFDRLTGDFWIGDVGSVTREEVNFQPAAITPPFTLHNYGWPCYEGTVVFWCNNGAPPFTPPVYDYGRDLGFSVIGGYVYRGNAIPALRGTYIAGDLGGRMFRFRFDPPSSITQLSHFVEPGVSPIYALGEDDSGELYVLTPGNGIFRIVSRCWANCDGSTIAPILNVEDFTCFINEFAAAQALPHDEQLNHYANCDSSTTAPVLNVEDFSCFINRFAAGCP